MRKYESLIGLVAGAILISVFCFSPLEKASADNAGFSVRTSAAFGVTSDSAYLSGLVNPGNTEAFFRFEYAPKDGRTITTELTPAGVGNYERIVSWQAQDLIPDTVYFYRLVAGNSAGVVAGHTLTFHTLPSRNKPTSVMSSPLSSLGGPFSWLQKFDSSQNQKKPINNSGNQNGTNQNNPSGTGANSTGVSNGNSGDGNNSSGSSGQPVSFLQSVWNFFAAFFVSLWHFFLRLWWLLLLLLLFLGILIYWFFFHKSSDEDSIEEIILKAREEFTPNHATDPEHLGSSGENKKPPININLG